MNYIFFWWLRSLKGRCFLHIVMPIKTCGISLRYSYLLRTVWDYRIKTLNLFILWRNFRSERFAISDINSGTSFIWVRKLPWLHKTSARAMKMQDYIVPVKLLLWSATNKEIRYVYFHDFFHLSYKIYIVDSL